MVQRLQSKYCAPHLRNAARAATAWTSPNEWTASIDVGDRQVSAEWTSDSLAPMGTGLSRIELAVRTYSGPRPYLALIYQFINYPGCLSELPPAVSDDPL